jgi:predicted Zn-dependent protease
MARARSMLPALAAKHRIETGKQWRLAGIATLALVSLIVVYVYGVPLLAGRIVGLVPADWEASLGETVATQMEAALKEQGGWEICDDNPNSVANRALARFATAAMEGSGSPFEVSITVVRTSIPNAFALPGGQVYYFSALLDQTDTPDEFAGVLAHEIGHVVHRHGMEQLIATAGTGALVGFILGDMTGISVAAGLGSALVDSRFSREHERQADQYSARIATRLAFKPQGLPDLLDRVASDDDFSKAMALFNTHPLTVERRQAFDALALDQSNLSPPFSAEEWQAIKAMCGPGTGGEFMLPSSTSKNKN